MGNAWFTNCGMNARKNSAVFTFNASVSIPSKRACLVPCGATEGMPATRRALRIERTPRKIRYMAPTYLTTRKAFADAASSAESPTAATATWTIPPMAVPTEDAMPSSTPPDKVRAMTYMMPGPGVTARTRAAVRKIPIGAVENSCANINASPSLKGSQLEYTCANYHANAGREVRCVQQPSDRDG